MKRVSEFAKWIGVSCVNIGLGVLNLIFAVQGGGGEPWFSGSIGVMGIGLGIWWAVSKVPSQ